MCACVYVRVWRACVRVNVSRDTQAPTAARAWRAKQVRCLERGCLLLYVRSCLSVAERETERERERERESKKEREQEREREKERVSVRERD